MKKIFRKAFLALTLFSTIAMVGCAGEQGPQGPQGEQGIPGEAGHTPNIAIGENGNWFIDGVDTGVKAEGKDGVNGKQIKNIKISENGELIITFDDDTVKENDFFEESNESINDKKKYEIQKIQIFEDYNKKKT